MLDNSEILKLFDAEDNLSESAEHGQLGFNVNQNFTDLEAWDNYTDMELYALDKAVRGWLRKIRYKKEKHDGVRTTASLVFLWIFGREPDPNSDRRIIKKLNALLRYYSQKQVKQTRCNGKNARNVYVFSKTGGNKMAYSIRLRIEEHESGDRVVSEKLLYSTGPCKAKW